MKYLSTLVVSLLLSACSQPEDQASPAAETGVAAEPGATHVAALTPAYLEGQWCHTHNIIGDERSDEMLNYIFSQDGTLLYQTNSSTEIEEPGSYVIVGNSIKIKPTLAFFNMQLETMTPDEFALKMGYGQMHWSRGACKPLNE